MAAHSDIPFKRLPVKIIGTGSYVPERRLTNADLEKMVDTSHEWIIERTGIVERRIAAPDEYTSHMGTKAAQRALESCGLKPEDIDLIIVATITPDTFTPSTSCYIQDALGAKNAAAFDISAACSGFLFAMKTAVQYIGTGQMKTALIIAAEKTFHRRQLGGSQHLRPVRGRRRGSRAPGLHGGRGGRLRPCHGYRFGRLPA